MNKTLKNNIVLFVILILIIIGLFIFRENEHKKDYFVFKEQIKTLELEKTDLNSIIKNLETDRDSLIERLEFTENRLTEEDEKNSKLNDDLSIISELISTDQELLMKYSRVFFLNEHYTPKKLSYIEDKWISNNTKKLQIHSEVEDNLLNLLEDAAEDKINLKILSAYRSFGDQAMIKNNYLVQYGTGANTFSADQGYSEHQLGTTVDFTTPELGAYLDTSFDQTAAFKWLQDNAYRYGFVMSYPKGNSYYQYEPWHWRFVSKNLARLLHRNNKNFYDMDQRDVYQHLIGFFD